MTLLLSDRIRAETFRDFIKLLDVTGEELSDVLSEHDEQEMVDLENHVRDGEEIDGLDAVAPGELDKETIFEMEIRYPSIIPEILDNREEEYIHTHDGHTCHEIYRVKGRITGDNVTGPGGEANA